jgi:hypothetical protein
MQILNLSATINVASLEPSINTYRLGEGAGTYEYPELNNKPKINGVTLVGDISSANLGIKTSDLTNDSGYISEADIPTATSDLVNDSGFVNSTQVQEVVSDAIPSDISYFDNDVGYITNADIGNIPTRTSQLENDSGYITAAEAPVVSVNNMTGAVVLDGTNIEYEHNVSLNSKIDAVEADIPTATSELTNDSGFITNASIPTRTSQLVNDSGFVNAQNIPVQSVNGETGAVVLTATDINYDSNNTVAAKIDANEQSIGDLSTLATADKLSLVRAVNEIASYTPVYGNIASGAIATFDTSLALPLQDCTIDINAVQDLHGYDKPWVGGAGKNLLPNEITSYTEAGVTFTTLENGKIKVNGTSNTNIYQHDICENFSLPEGTYILSYDAVANLSVQICNRAENHGYLSVDSQVKSRTFTVTSAMVNDMKVRFTANPNKTFNNAVTGIMIRLASEPDATFEPYENICPITGHDSGVITVENDQIANTYTVDFGQSVYGGRLNVTTGELVVTHSFIASYNGENITEPWISSMDNYVPNTLPSIGAQVVYPLTTPISLSITSKDVRTLLGNNNIFADTNGDTSVVYVCSLKDYIDRQ